MEMFFYIVADRNKQQKMLTTIFLTCTIAYVVQMLILRMGLTRSEKATRAERYEPTVSVIVAARNEEEHIGDCIASLLQLDYPPAKLEIIIVNDNSTDQTANRIKSFLGKSASLKMITVSPGTGTMRGKANALAQGIHRSSGKILLFTDADCTVPRQWVRETVQYFTDDVGVVGGFTLLEANRIFEGIQSLDWIFLFGLASSMAGLNRPLTAIGNNVSIRRAAYDAVGGYEVIPFSVTEDYALVHTIYQNTKYRVVFPINPGTVVISSACRTFHHLYHQKQRWGAGGLDMVFRGKAIMTIGWLAKLGMVGMAFLLQGKFFLIDIAAIGFIELLYLWKPLSRFKKTALLKYFFAFEIYFTIYVLIIPFIAYFRKNVVWKERNL